ncbi:hypothetical protein CspeluHIS016_0201810 [Cutaneotrichosporon spelunceum]|uniref:Small ribosomal subunit protein eS1 n=1 Tax=Cutaneotrichosporon spelunceum TaxID=1672016 RepID=A0AAD3TQT8_9TREE|nr:hypothetical protein CspeluHIS016_0201810 [Cutaneotrichosporon spelunceum]
MAGSTNAWTTSSPAPEADLATHLSSLAVDDFNGPTRTAGGSNPPAYNVHTAPRPAFAPYDANTQFLYYAVAASGNSLDPATFSPQHFPYELGTPLPSQAADMTYDPYTSPSETYQHNGDNCAPSTTPYQQQQPGLVGARGNHVTYRPPHMVQQLRDLQDLTAAQQQQQFFYNQRSGFWGTPHTSERGVGSMASSVAMSPSNSRNRNNRMGSGGPRRSSSGQHSHLASQLVGFPDPQTASFASLAASYTNAYGLQTPLTPTLTGPCGHSYPFPTTYGAAYSPTPMHFGGFVPNGKRGRHGHIEDPGIVRSRRLEDFRQRKNSRMEFSEIYGSICEFAGDQHGSRFIQNKLETASPEERAKVFDEIMPNAYQLMTDVFGNYVIQKLFEHGDQQQKAALAKKMEGHVLQLSMQMYGCRVMQKALEHLLLEQREKLVAELEGHIIECVKSSNANHVIQRLISLDPPKEVTDAFIGHVQELSAHPFGCRVLQKSFEVLDPVKIRPLLDEMHSCSLKLMTDQFGNYVVQSVLTDAPGREVDRDRVIGEMKGRIFELSRHKFASNVVERAIRTSKREGKRAIIAEMMGDSVDEGENRISTLLRDGFGNFTVQTALIEAEPDQRDQLLAIIVPLMPQLRHSPCGRRLDAKIQEYEAKGILPSSGTNSSPDHKDMDGASSDTLVVPNGKGASAIHRTASPSSSSTTTHDEQLVYKVLNPASSTRLTLNTQLKMAVGKNKRLSKGKKGIKKKVVDPFTRKDWYDIKAPSFFENRNAGKTLVNRSQGLRNANDSLKGRILELSLADLHNSQDLSYRKIKLRVEDVSGKNCLTSFYGMDFTTDKLRSLVRKWQTLIEASVDVKTTDGYILRLFAIGFTQRNRHNQVKKTTYAQSSQVREIRAKMVEIMRREAEGSDLKELVQKFVPESIGTEIEKASKGIYPLHNVYIRKCKIVKAPKLDMSKLLETHGEAADASGSKVIKGGDFVEPEILASV